jgi:phage replication O-like protein O
MATKGFEKQTYTQVPNSLFEIMHEMDECELKVVLYICRYTFGYHREEVKISTRKLAEAIGMNTASVAKGGEAAAKRGLIEKVIDGQNTTIWRALVSDSKNESPDSDSEIEPAVIQKLNHIDSDNESQVGVKESVKKVSKKLINKEPLKHFTGYFGKFLSMNEIERWQILYEIVGKDQAEKLLSWAYKKEIHMTNRGGLLDSLETAAKNWKEKQAPKQPTPRVRQSVSSIYDEYDRQQAGA